MIKNYLLMGVQVFLFLRTTLFASTNSLKDMVKVHLCIHSVDLDQASLKLPAVCDRKNLKYLVYDLNKSDEKLSKNNIFSNIFGVYYEKDKKKSSDKISHHLNSIWLDKTKPIQFLSEKLQINKMSFSNVLIDDLLKKIIGKNFDLYPTYDQKVTLINLEISKRREAYHVLKIIENNIENILENLEKSQNHILGMEFLKTIQQNKLAVGLEIRYITKILKLYKIFSNIEKMSLLKTNELIQDYQLKPHHKNDNNAKNIQSKLSILDDALKSNKTNIYGQINEKSLKIVSQNNIHYFGTNDDRVSYFRQNRNIGTSSIYMLSSLEVDGYIPVDQKLATKNQIVKPNFLKFLNKSSYMALRVSLSDFLPASIAIPYSINVSEDGHDKTYYALYDKEKIRWASKLSKDEEAVMIHADPRSVDKSSQELLVDWIFEPHKSHDGKQNINKFINFIFEKSVNKNELKKMDKQEKTRIKKSIKYSAYRLIADIEPIALSQSTFNSEKIIFDTSENDEAREFVDIFNIVTYDPSLNKYFELLKFGSNDSERLLYNRELANGFEQLNIFYPKRLALRYPLVYINSLGVIQTIEKSTATCVHQNYIDFLSKLYKEESIEVIFNPAEMIKYPEDWKCQKFPIYVQGQLGRFINDFNQSSSGYKKLVGLPKYNGKLLDFYKKSLPNVWGQ